MSPDELLGHAMKLASNAPEGVAEDVELRRAISAAYYALFHRITTDAAKLIAPNVDDKVRHRIQRWFEHTQMKQICGRFLNEILDQPLAALVGEQASAPMRNVCRTFIEAQEARHSADYDLDYIIDKPRAMQMVRNVVLADWDWKRISKTHEANIFILSLLMWKQWDRERS